MEGSDNWVELKDGRAKSGLNPLIIGEVIAKVPCPGKGAASVLPFKAGQAQIIPATDPRLGVSCPGKGSVIAANERNQLALNLHMIWSEDLRAERGVRRF